MSRKVNTTATVAQKPANTTAKTPVAPVEKPETITLYATYERKTVRFDVTATPFAEGATSTTLLLNPDNFVVLKAGASVPQGTTVHDSVQRALLTLVRKQCVALQKAVDEARDERIRKAEYSFAAFADERITVRYSPSAKLQKGSSVLWDLTCNVQRVDADMGDKNAIKDGAMAQALKLHEAMCAMREQKPGCPTGKAFEKELTSFYAGLNGYTVNGRRIHLLKGCVPTKHLLEEKVKENNAYVRRDADRFTVDDMNRKYRAMFYSVLFADDKTLAYKAD